MTTVVVADEAEQHLRDIVAWWKENRLAAPDLVRCVRRVVMKRTRHLKYYLHDETNAIVYVIAVGGAPKEGDPVLVDPRR